MDKHLNIYKNWRFIVLLALGTLAALFLLGECEDIGLLFLTKCIGMALGYTTYRIGKYWKLKGKLNELTNL